MKSFALSLAFIMRFTVTRKWPIQVVLIVRAKIHPEAKASLKVGRNGDRAVSPKIVIKTATQG